MSWTERVLTSLSGKGHRVTGPRRAILDRIVQYPHPFSAEELWIDLGGDPKHGTGPIGRATIYRTVELLVDEHWLARVHWSRSRETSAEGDHAYVPIDQGHQHHLVCKSCGTVVTFEGCQIEELLGGLAERLNFRIDGHWLEVFGMCQTCQRRGVSS
jgi:Fur family transcriptional regulator, ferric uptake regulator